MNEFYKLSEQSELSEQYDQHNLSQINQIIQSLPKIKSAWELLYYVPITFKHVNWIPIIDILTPLFRKDTFFRLIGKKNYYPQPTPNCRYYIKPNDGSCGKGIEIVDSLPLDLDKNYIACPEIITPLIKSSDINSNQNTNYGYKYDYRVWIGICSLPTSQISSTQTNLTYFICPTFILRVSSIPFNPKEKDGSLTNTSLYSEQFNHNDVELYEKVNIIVKDVLNEIKIMNQFEGKFKQTNQQHNSSDQQTNVMLTGWDFIVNELGDVFVLEVNCSPGINILHEKVMKEYLNWINVIETNVLSNSYNY